MSRARASALLAVDSLGEIIEEINRFEFGPPTRKGKRSKKSSSKKPILAELDDSFWDAIREEISRMLVTNYNAIRMMNTPKYAEWKKRAKEEGLSVVATEGGKPIPVLYVRGALLTGTLRERVRNVRVNRRKISQKNVNPESIQYSVDLSGLRNAYDKKFQEWLKSGGYEGDEIFVLRDDQANTILEMILSKIAEDL